MPKTEITYEIVQQIGILKENKSGWQRELNIVKWNNGKKFNPYKFTILDDKYLLAIFMEEEEEQDTISVTPTSTTVTFTWSLIIDAYTYSLTIYLDAAKTIPFCTITFNKHGQLMGIKFGNRIPYRNMEQKDGFTYTVSGLNANTEYYFKMESIDEDSKLINTDEGSFYTTAAATSVEYQQSNVVLPYKVMVDGQIFIRRGDRTYTILGQNVK